MIRSPKEHQCASPGGLRNDVALVLAWLAVLSSAWGSKRPAASVKGPDADVEQFDLLDLEAAVRAMPIGPDHDYFAGMLANADNHIEESIQLLMRALPAIRKSRPDRAVAALRALADDYNKVFRYDDAAPAYEDLLNNFSDQMSAQDLKDVKDDLPLAKILSHAPAQTVTLDGPALLKTEPNPLGSQNAERTVNGVQGPCCWTQARIFPWSARASLSAFISIFFQASHRRKRG